MVGNGVGFSCSEVLVLMNLVVLWDSQQEKCKDH